MNTQLDSSRRVGLRPWQKDAGSVIVLAVLLLAVFWPVLFQHRTLLPTDEFDTMTLPFSSDYGPAHADNHMQTDGMMQSYPWKFYAQRAFRSGSIAYWNPLILGGYPQYAASRQWFDVFNVLLLLFELPLAFHLIIILQLWVAGIGMLLLLRWHGRSHAVALMFAAAWMLNGMFLTHGTNLWATATFCWVPFALAMLLRYYERRKPMYAASTGLFLALAFLGSTLQSAVYVVILVLIASACYARSNKLSWARYFGPITIIFAIAFALSAILWLPTLELFREVVLHGWLYSPTHALAYTIPHRILSLGLLATFYVPELLGQIRSLTLTSIAGVHPLDFSGYLGFPEMLLATWAVVSLRRSPANVRGFGWLVILGFLLPICTPLFSWLYHRFFIVGTLGAVVVGAERLDALVYSDFNDSRFRVWVKRVLWSAGLLVGVLTVTTLVLTLDPALASKLQGAMLARAAGTAFADGNDVWVRARVEGTFQHYAIWSPTMFVPFLALFAVCTLLLQRTSWRFSRDRYVLSLFCLSILPMIFWWRTWLPMVDTQAYPLLPQHRTIQFLQDQSQDARIFADRELVPGNQYVFLDNLPSMYGISDICGYESELPRCLYGVISRISPAQPHVHTLGLWAVKDLLFLRAIVPSGNLPVADTGAITVYENPRFLPRARIVYHSITLANDSAVLGKIFDESDGGDAAILCGTEPSSPMLSDTLHWSAASILSEPTNEVVLSANAQHAGYLVLSDTYYPGWTCFVDGVERPIVRANFAMRAVLLSAGPHRVVFRFSPDSFRIGLGISAISLACLLVFFGRSMVRSRDSQAR